MADVVANVLPTLYTLDSFNKVRIFKASVVASSTEDGYAIKTETGLIDGKLTPKMELVKKGKQKRNVYEQAIFQLNALWRQKLDEGYKSLDDLVKRLLEFNIIQVNYNITEQEILAKAINYLPNFAYTNSNWDELPMLAHKIKDVKVLNFPYIIQPKLDGVRCLVKKKNLDAVLISRGGQYYQIPHLINDLTIFLKRLGNAGYSSLLLDGEIYKHGIPLQEISGAARKEENGMFASNSWLEYHIYDVISLIDSKASQRERDLLLTINQKYSFDLLSIKFVESKKIYSKEEAEMVHNYYVSQGYEGAILRNPMGIYEFNTRSYSLIKIKEYQDEEFEIIACGNDENKSIGESFYFVLKNNINDLIFKSRPTGTEKQKEYWFYNIDKFKGKKATVRFFTRSNDGLPTQGVVRHKDTEILVKHIRSDGE